MYQDGGIRTSSLDGLVDDLLLLALVHVGIALLDEGLAGVGETESVEALVHGALERIILPAEDVVTVMPIPGTVDLIRL